MNFFRKLFLGTLLATLSIGIVNSVEIEHIDWALHDLLFAKEAILENHPGVYNKLDPEFCTNLDISFNDAQIKLNNTQDDNMRKQILHEFSKSFNDAHLRIRFSQEPSITTHVQQQALRAQFSCDVTDSVCSVRIPTFAPNQEETENIKSIIDTMTTIREIPYIIFDVRGNTGGSSIWGNQIVDALFGAGYTHHKRAQALTNQYLEWRASASNIEYLKAILIDHIYKNFGQYSKEAKGVELIIDGMQKAHDIGNMLYHDSSRFHDITDITLQDSLCLSTIIIVIDSHCVSACLSFIDELKLMGIRIVLVGQQTSADTLYMECRSIALPSGKGRIVIPIKVYRNRPRGHNIPYTPNIEYRGDINDTCAIKNFIFGIIQRMNDNVKF